MGPFLFLVGAVGVVIALIALIRGRLGWAHLEGRKPAAWTLIGAFLVFSVGAAVTPQPATTSTAAPQVRSAAGHVGTPGLDSCPDDDFSNAARHVAAGRCVSHAAQRARPSSLHFLAACGHPRSGRGGAA